ncbi:hypothetical protein YTPLAS72_11470 [Nitrospira sp.]|nr:hypothetical protein YTPLAS72_11470 [Nitrospira sp.]
MKAYDWYLYRIPYEDQGYYSVKLLRRILGYPVVKLVARKSFVQNNTGRPKNGQDTDLQDPFLMRSDGGIAVGRSSKKKTPTRLAILRW